MKGIKFRLFDAKSGEFDYFTLDSLIDSDRDPYDEPIIDFDESEQYTGLKDKNGVEIYEGDIYDLTGEGELLGVVSFNVQRASFVGVPVEKWNGGKYKTLYASEHLYGAGDSIVIGGIHQNPELLELKQ